MQKLKIRTVIAFIPWNQLKIVVPLFLAELLLSNFLIYSIMTNQIHTDLEHKIGRAKEDLQFTNNTWNLRLYNKDPQLVGNYPLYLITSDGYILDRRIPIHGFLDTADFKRLLFYNKPQTLSTITNQTRRVYAQPILDNKTTIGVIAVSYFNPQPPLLSYADNRLISTAKLIASEIKIHNGAIDTSALDERKIPYDVSFTIVDRYNTTLQKTTNVNSMNRIPNFLDSSYVKAELNAPKQRIIRDNQTGEIFLTQTDVIKDAKGNTLGFITIGQTIQHLVLLLTSYTAMQGILGFLLVIIYLSVVAHARHKQKRTNKRTSISKVIFDEAKGILTIDNTDITIPYATNQFYLLQAVFHKPNKRWETDELLKRFGEDSNAVNGRKVYDTMIKLNKKVENALPYKLIINQNKTYQLNPQIPRP